MGHGAVRGRGYDRTLSPLTSTACCRQPSCPFALGTHFVFQGSRNRHFCGLSGLGGRISSRRAARMPPSPDNPRAPAGFWWCRGAGERREIVRAIPLWCSSTRIGTRPTKKLKKEGGRLRFRSSWVRVRARNGRDYLSPTSALSAGFSGFGCLPPGRFRAGATPAHRYLLATGSVGFHVLAEKEIGR